MNPEALIQNDASVLGLLAILLAVVFYTAQSEHVFFRRFYRYVPALLMCYFLPSLLNTFNIIDGTGSNLYFVASRYLLPSCLVLLTLSVDFQEIAKLGKKAVILFFTGTVGIIIGAPIALLLVSMAFPELLNGNGPEAVWRGMTTVAGAWIGGGANQAAMKEIYDVGDNVFSAWVTVDVLVANIWMACLLIMAANSRGIDAKTGADVSALRSLQKKVEEFHATHARIPQLPDLMIIIGVGFGVTGFAHLLADIIQPWMVEHVPGGARYSLHSGFFWLIVIASLMGLGLSFTRARKLEAVGASKIGSAMLYILIATIGMQMNIRAVAEVPLYFVIGITWMIIHAALMLAVAKFINAPVFYMAVGSMANVGGAASAPVIAAAFHPALAPVGVLLAVLGYTVGTYMAWFCGQILQVIGAS